MKSHCVVISHYNAWPPDQLVALLDQLKSIPAGLPYHCRVVVNRARDVDLALPDRHADVEVTYRENTGYNIGAWDMGWRQEPRFDDYLFLQEECQILKANWLRAFVDRLDDPKVGLVGESLHWGGFNWKRLDHYYRDFPFAAPIDGKDVPTSEGVRVLLARKGIPIGPTGAHLQSLVLCTRREVLEATDGFMIGDTYAEAIIAEVAASKRVEAMGLKVVEVGRGAFQYVLHPQWANKKATIPRRLFLMVEPFIPIPIAGKIRRAAFQAKQKRQAPSADAPGG